MQSLILFHRSGDGQWPDRGGQRKPAHRLKGGLCIFRLHCTGQQRQKPPVLFLRGCAKADGRISKTSSAVFAKVLHFFFQECDRLRNTANRFLYHTAGGAAADIVRGSAGAQLTQECQVFLQKLIDAPVRQRQAENRKIAVCQGVIGGKGIRKAFGAQCAKQNPVHRVRRREESGLRLHTAAGQQRGKSCGLCAAVQQGEFCSAFLQIKNRVAAIHGGRAQPVCSSLQGQCFVLLRVLGQTPPAKAAPALHRWLDGLGRVKGIGRKPVKITIVFAAQELIGCLCGAVEVISVHKHTTFFRNYLLRGRHEPITMAIPIRMRILPPNALTSFQSSPSSVTMTPSTQERIAPEAMKLTAAATK